MYIQSIYLVYTHTGRFKVSSSFKTQQAGQGRKPKVEFKVHSDLARRPNKNQWFIVTRP
jgi:hypothetical protein